MSTMLETYDAHMSDYPIDVDSDMQHPAEPWFDAKMDDDLPLENHFADHESTLSVEVDMEDHYEENEYEMGDGEGEENYEEMSSDLLDIEVYDVTEPLEDATIPSAESLKPPDSRLFSLDPASAEKPLLLPVAATPAMSAFPPPDEELPDAPEHVEVIEEEEDESAAVQPYNPSLELVTPLPDENAETTDEISSNESAHVQEQPDADNTETPHHEEDRQAPDAASPVVEEQDPADAEHGRALEDPGRIEDQDSILEAQDRTVEDLDHTVEGHNPTVEDQDHTVEENNRPVEEPTLETVAADPHEISEGVYIDPPPAVLVSFESSHFPDVCLFNQPARSRSPSPSTEGHAQAYQVFDVLLHHRPILYYEPLASVFEALRQEEYLTRIPQFADSELILDAYDLQLVISEDNIYAREVTLHDLNVLHDGSDVAGPLRLRLTSVVPRFILRYHLLQDQVARLNLAVAGDEQETSNPQQ
ncbi:hypothetical protein C8R43DRAFT_138401 [Mycena crocata]|nr:hypothetical protein C8R43DRAFT_138401 [Mycena crocata]